MSEHSWGWVKLAHPRLAEEIENRIRVSRWEALFEITQLTRDIEITMPIDIAPEKWINPADYDVYLTDVSAGDVEDLAFQNHEAQRQIVAEPGVDVSVMRGNFIGLMRPFVRCLVQRRCGDPMRVVWMLYDTGSPFTFFTQETWRVFGLEPPVSEGLMLINGISTKVGVSHGHFKDIDLLGGNFMQSARADVVLSYKTLTITVKIAHEHG